MPNEQKRKRPLWGPFWVLCGTDQSSSPSELFELELFDAFELELDELLELELLDELEELFELELPDELELEFEPLLELELLFEFDPHSAPERLDRSALRTRNCTCSTVSPTVVCAEGVSGLRVACAPRGSKASNVAGRRAVNAFMKISDQGHKVSALHHDNGSGRELFLQGID